MLFFIVIVSVIVVIVSVSVSVIVTLGVIIITPRVKHAKTSQIHPPEHQVQPCPKVAPPPNSLTDKEKQPP